VTAGPDRELRRRFHSPGSAGTGTTPALQRSTVSRRKPA
jgi:hypothetical protein